MYYHLELALLAGEERRSRLLAEAAQWRLLNAKAANLAQPTGRAAWLRHRLTGMWRWLTQSLTHPRTPQQFIQKYNP